VQGRNERKRKKSGTGRARGGRLNDVNFKERIGGRKSACGKENIPQRASLVSDLVDDRSTKVKTLGPDPHPKKGEKAAHPRISEQKNRGSKEKERGSAHGCDAMLWRNRNKTRGGKEKSN